MARKILSTIRVDTWSGRNGWLEKLRMWLFMLLLQRDLRWLRRIGVYIGPYSLVSFFILSHFWIGSNLILSALRLLRNVHTTSPVWRPAQFPRKHYHPLPSHRRMLLLPTYRVQKNLPHWWIRVVEITACKENTHKWREEMGKIIPTSHDLNWIKREKREEGKKDRGGGGKEADVEWKEIEGGEEKPRKGVRRRENKDNEQREKRDKRGKIRK